MTDNKYPVDNSVDKVDNLDNSLNNNNTETPINTNVSTDNIEETKHVENETNNDTENLLQNENTENFDKKEITENLETNEQIQSEELSEVETENTDLENTLQLPDAPQSPFLDNDIVSELSPREIAMYNKMREKDEKNKLKQEEKANKRAVKLEKREVFYKKVRKVIKVINITLTYILAMALASLATYTYLYYNDYIVLPVSEQEQTTARDPLNADAPSIDIVEYETSDTTVPLTEGVVLTPPQINAKVLPSVVVIQSNTLGGGYGTGTGIVLSEDGYIITNSHVVATGDVFTVYMYDNQAFKAELIGNDEETDLAIIKIDPKEYTLVPAEFGNSANVVVGDVAFAIGTPGGIELQSTFTGGYISAISREIVIEDKTMTLIQTDAAINPGNSGGPLINHFGQVIGINTIKIVDEEYEGLGFAIPMNEAKPILEEIMVYGYVSGRPAIGITGRNITEAESVQNDIPRGLYVDTVDIRSSAYEAGLKSGDIITGVNGITTVSSDEINVVRDEFIAGDTITLNVYRAGTTLDIDIMLMDQYDLQGQIVGDNVDQAVPTVPTVPEEETPSNGYYNPFGGFWPFFD